ncbi:MAG: PEP-CTERM sorting domain-containing protein [Phycisphaeraceae bacterium]
MNPAPNRSLSRLFPVALLSAMSLVPASADAELVTYNHAGAFDQALSTNLPDAPTRLTRLDNGRYSIDFTFDASAMSDGVLTFDELVAIDGKSYITRTDQRRTQAAIEAQAELEQRQSDLRAAVRRRELTRSAYAEALAALEPLEKAAAQTETYAFDDLHQTYSLDPALITPELRALFSIAFDGTRPGAAVSTSVDAPPSYMLLTTDGYSNVSLVGTLPGEGVFESVTSIFDTDAAAARAGDVGQWTYVPEPGSLALLTLGSLLIARRRRDG